MKEEKNKSKIGSNIKALRLKLGISQDTLSKKADLAFHTISKIEAGSTPNPTIETLRKIANALNVSVNDLIK
jgi:transcriptional regulator with XRE-family HTH domain